jgi:hypothetical protein
VSSHLWSYNGNTVDNYPGNSQCESLGHILADSIELGWRVEHSFDPTDAQRLAWRLDNLITDRLMEALQ